MRNLCEIGKQQQKRTSYDPASESNEYHNTISLSIPLNQLKFDRIDMLKVAPGPKNTYFLYQHFFSQLRQVDKYGNVLTLLSLPNSGSILGSIYTISQSVIIFLFFNQLTKFCELVQWDILNNKCIQLQFKQTASYMCTLQFFEQSKLACFVNYRSTQNGGKSTIQCFKCPLSSNTDQPIKIIHGSNLTQKINNHSKIAFYDRNLKNSIKIQVHDLFSSTDIPQIHQLNFKHVQKMPQLYSLKLIDVWSPTQSTIYIQLQQIFDTNKFLAKHTTITEKHHQDAYNLAAKSYYHHLIWEYKEKKEQDNSLKQIVFDQEMKVRDCVVQFVGSLRATRILKICQKFQLILPGKNYKPKQLYPEYLPIFLINPSSNYTTISKIPPLSPSSNTHNTNKTKNKTKYKYILYELQKQKQKQKRELKIYETTINMFYYHSSIVCTFFICSLVECVDDDLVFFVVTLNDRDRDGDEGE